MKLKGFGGIIPFIGFRRSQVPAMVAMEAGIRQSRLVEGANRDFVWVDCFEVEWFGWGVTLMMKGVA